MRLTGDTLRSRSGRVRAPTQQTSEFAAIVQGAMDSVIPATMIDRLFLAADLVRSVKLTLDDSAESCECCDSKRYTNYPEHLQVVRLKGFEEKLRNALAVMCRQSAEIPDRPVRTDIPDLGGE